MSNSINKIDLELVKSFATQLRGKIIMPSDANYDKTRCVYNAMIDKHPGMIVICNDVADVMASVNFARENNLTLAIRGGVIMGVDWDFVMMD